MKNEELQILIDNSVMTVKELSKVMKVSLPTAYTLVKSEGFPVIYVGNSIRIPCKAFSAWLDTKAAGGTVS